MTVNDKKHVETTIKSYKKYKLFKRKLHYLI